MCNKVFLVFRQFIIYLTVFGIALVFIYTSSPKLQEDYGDIIDFGFEAFINLVENGELSTASSDGLTEYHLSIWPQNQKHIILVICVGLKAIVIMVILMLGMLGYCSILVFLE